MAVRIFRKPIVLKKDTPKSFLIPFQKSDGTFLDMSSYDFRCVLRYEAGGTIIKTLTNDNGDFGFDDDGRPFIVFTQNTLNLFEVDVENSTVDFPFVIVYFDIEYKSGTDWRPYFMGTLRVYEGLTDE